MPGALPAIHMQDLAGHKPGVFQVVNRLGNITHRPHMPPAIGLMSWQRGQFWRAAGGCKGGALHFMSDAV